MFEQWAPSEMRFCWSRQYWSLERAVVPVAVSLGAVAVSFGSVACWLVLSTLVVVGLGDVFVLVGLFDVAVGLAAAALSLFELLPSVACPVAIGIGIGAVAVSVLEIVVDFAVTTTQQPLEPRASNYFFPAASKARCPKLVLSL